MENVRYLVSSQAGIKGCETLGGKVFCSFAFLPFPMESKGLSGVNSGLVQIFSVPAFLFKYPIVFCFREFTV